MSLAKPLKEKSGECGHFTCKNDWYPAPPLKPCAILFDRLVSFLLVTLPTSRNNIFRGAGSALRARNNMVK